MHRDRPHGIVHLHHALHKQHAIDHQNPGHGHHWLTLELAGRRSNRSAIGARVTVEIEASDGPDSFHTRSIHRRVGTGGSFGGSPLRQEIGLGDATRIRRLEVYWPTSGTRQVFTSVAMDRAYRLVEGEDKLVPRDHPPIQLGGREGHRHRPAARSD